MGKIPRFKVAIVKAGQGALGTGSAKKIGGRKDAGTMFFPREFAFLRIARAPTAEYGG